MWHIEVLLKYLAQNIATVAIPTCAKSLDKNTVQFKGRTVARSHIKCNPVKFGIRLYLLAERSHAYLYSLAKCRCDN